MSENPTTMGSTAWTASSISSGSSSTSRISTRYPRARNVDARYPRPRFSCRLKPTRTTARDASRWRAAVLLKSSHTTDLATKFARDGADLLVSLCCDLRDFYARFDQRRHDLYLPRPVQFSEQQVHLWSRVADGLRAPGQERREFVVECHRILPCFTVRGDADGSAQLITPRSCYSDHHAAITLRAARLGLSNLRRSKCAKRLCTE